MNLFDYLAWRGDLSFANAPLCPVDALIFSTIAYVNFDGAVPDSARAEPVRLSEAAERYFAAREGDAPDTAHERLLRALAASPRFRSLRLVGARRALDRANGVQFAALTVLLPKQNLFLAFEGTDATLIGWREDFRMSYECPVPAQLHAADYLRAVAAAFPLRRLFLGGHSKGGNLAMYAAVHGGEENRPRVVRVYNNDGPGFCDGTLASPAYLQLKNRIETYLPQSSVVGVLLEHEENYRVVKSTRSGLFQHDPYSWEVCGTGFVEAKERTAFGKQTEAILSHFMNDLSPERKRLFTEALFTVLESAERDTVAEIGTHMGRSVASFIRSYAGLSPESRKALSEAISALNQSRKAVRKATVKVEKSS